MDIPLKIKRKFEGHWVNFTLCTVLLTCVVLPDFLINWATHSQRAFGNWEAFGGILLTVVGLSYAKKTLFWGVWGVFFIIELCQFIHIVYFGTTIRHATILLSFGEARDIFVLTYLKFVWFVFPIVGACYGLGAFIFNRLRPFKKTTTWTSAAIVFYGITLCATDFSFLPRSAIPRLIYHGQMTGVLFLKCINMTDVPIHSLVSSLRSILCVVIRIFFNPSNPSYLSYQFISEAPLARNILLVVGESLTASHMSLFGYHRPTTPFLCALAKNKQHFLYKKSYASSVFTASSLPYMFNCIREPHHYALFNSPQSNLIQIAKKQGFKVTVITTNDGTQCFGIGIDDLYTGVRVRTYPFTLPEKVLWTQEDLGLPKILSSLSLETEKNLIIVHMYAPHSPYENRYRKAPECALYDDRESANARINAYDNAVVFTDMILKQLFLEFEKRFGSEEDNFFVFFSDHGELLGEKDPLTGAELWGHGNLTPACLLTPFFFYTTSTLGNWTKKYSDRPAFSGYEVSRFILELLGVGVTNPNQKTPETYFASDGVIGGCYLEYTIDPEGNMRVIDS